MEYKPEMPYELVDMDFVSPLDIKLQQVASGTGKAAGEYLDNKVFGAVEAVVTVDKDELIKALAYDRNQHEKGFKDGYLAGYAAGYEVARFKYDDEYEGLDNDD